MNNRMTLALIILLFCCSCVKSPAQQLIDNTSVAPWSANERTIAIMQDKLKREGESPEANATLGHAWLQKARETGDPLYYSKAELLFDRALTLSPEYVAALSGKASLAMSRHEFKEAKRIATHVTQLNPDYAAVWGILADAFVELGEYERGIEALEKMIRLKPNLSSYSRIAYMRELHGDIAGAEQAMQMAIEAGAPNSENTAWCIVQLGDLYLQSGRISEAQQAYRYSLMRFPGYVHGYAGLARAEVALGNLAPAIAFYQKAIDALPLPELLLGLGEVYEQMGKLVDARAQYNLVRDIQKIYRSNGVSGDAAIILFEADHGDPKTALKLAEDQWSRSKSIKTADVYAWALYRAGELDKARDVMRQALRLGTKEPGLLRRANKILGEELVSATIRKSS